MRILFKCIGFRQDVAAASLTLKKGKAGGDLSETKLLRAKHGLMPEDR